MAASKETETIEEEAVGLSEEEGQDLTTALLEEEEEVEEADSEEEEEEGLLGRETPTIWTRS